MSGETQSKAFNVSDYVRTAMGNLDIPESVKIFDTTLRDGEQTPGIAYTIDSKARIARQLEKLGVDIIEAGMPITSEGEKESIKRIVSDVSVPETCVLARTMKEDIDAAIDCGVDRIHVFIATSDIHLRDKLRMTREEVLLKATESVQYAKDRGAKVEFSAEDATRTDLEYLKRICAATVEAGADIVNIPDTVGVMTPRAMYSFIKEIRQAVRAPLSIHCHNDFGMATANSLAAVEAGAQQVHVCVNGLGERAGNASLEQVVMSLMALFGTKLNVRPAYISETSDLVQRLSGIYLPATSPIIGDNAFSHEAGIHVHGVLGNPATYEPMSPELVGKQRRLVAGKHSGRHGIKRMVEEMGFQPSDLQLKEIQSSVKRLGDLGKKVTDVDLYALTKSILNIESEQEISLKELTVITGKNITPTASAVINYGGKDFAESSIGIGPIDAAINAIKKSVKTFTDIELERFNLEAITGGTDALGDVTVRLRRGDRAVTSRGVSPDIVMASVEAIVLGMNRLEHDAKVKAGTKIQ